MFDLTRLAIEKKRITLTVLLLILVMGTMTYFKLPRAEDPGFIIRTARVTTEFPGASPERVENLVTDKLEKVIQEMPEVEYITSESRTGISIITVEILEKFTDMRPIWDTLRRKVNRVAPSLPEGTSTPFVNDEFGDVFGTIVSITGSGFTYKELKEIADDVRDELLFLDDAAKVDIYGAQKERVFVEYRDAKLAEIGISASQLQQVLESRNIITPGGAIETEEERIYVEPSGNFETVEEIENSVINLPGQQAVVYLKDIAKVSRGYIDPPENITLTNNTRSLLLAISMREGGNILSFGQQTKKVIRELEEKYPIGVQFSISAYQPGIVQKKVDDFVSNLLQSVVIVILVMMLFLGLRTGLIVATLVPLTILATFFFMGVFSIGIDQISLAALIISLGMLVDNAIVMSESILIEAGKGKTLKEASIDSARELKIPLLTSSLTTAAAFLPIYLAKSSAGEYTASIFKVVTISLLCSWLLALTMIPVLCVYFLKVKKEKERLPRFYAFYRRALLWLLRKRALGMGVFLLLFVSALVSLQYVPKMFFPPSDRPLFTAKIELPIGTKIEKTEKMIETLENYFQNNLLSTKTEDGEGIVSWVSYIGGRAPRYVLTYNPVPTSPEVAFLMIDATSLDAMPLLMQQIETYMTDHFPSARVTLRPTELGPPVESPVEVRLSGNSTEALYETVQQVKEKLHAIEGVKNIRDDWGPLSKKLIVTVNQPRALRAGVTNRDIATSLQTMLSGFETSQFREEDEVIPITFRSIESDRQDLDKLETLNVYSQNGEFVVPLAQVADRKIIWQPSKIYRRDRKKTTTVQADIQNNVTASEVVKQLQPWLDKQQANWPIGSFYEIGGEVEKSTNANAAIREQIPYAAFLIILLLIVQFDSFLRPLIIMLTIPLGIIGVSFGLLITSSYIGFMTLLGIVSLSGIVINNAIVLLDRIQIEQEEFHRPPQEAILEASVRRLRPILLTTLTTVVALIPLWYGGGVMFEPMAVTIIFGLLFATVLTLGFVPILYSFLYKVPFHGEKK